MEGSDVNLNVKLKDFDEQIGNLLLLVRTTLSFSGVVF